MHWTGTYNRYDAICLPQKSVWEKLKKIGLDLFGKGKEIESASTRALMTYLNSQLLDPKIPAAIKDSVSTFEPIKQLYTQKVYSSYYKTVTPCEIGGIVEVSMY